MEIKRFRHLKWLSCLILLCTLGMGVATAQTLLCGTQTAPPPNGNNQDSLIFDRFGNAFDIEDLLVPSSNSLISAGGCQSGYFDLTFDANFPMNMRATICEVFADLSETIVHHGNELGCGDLLPAQHVAISVVWTPITPSDILGTGTPFYSGPQDGQCREMILDRPFIKINGGIINPFANEIFDGRLEINSMPQTHSGVNLAWHIDSSTPVLAGEVDLYSVALHESLHILGFASRVGLNDAYSLWDRILHITKEFVPNGGSQSVTPILSNSSPDLPCTSSSANCWGFNESVVNSGTIGNLINNTCSSAAGTPDIVVGETAIAAIDWANTGSDGAALSHLSETCNNSPAQTYVMRGGFDPGMERREISQDELQILCELGYQVNTTNYNCSGCYAIAHPDGIDPNSCCSQVFHGCIGEPIEILNSELLCNDVTNGPALNIGRIWVVNSNLSSFVDIAPNTDGSGWVITFSPSPDLASTVAMNYSIVGCDCRMHNARFSILLENQCPSCIYDGEMCENLLCYEDFENYTNTDGFETWLGYPFLIDGNIRVGTPDLNVVNSNHFLFMGAGSTFQNATEPVTMELNKCISPGCDLILDVDLANGGSPSTLAVWGSTNPPCPATLAPAVAIADNCTEITTCGPNYTYHPVCIGSPLPVASTIVNTNDFNFGPDNHVTQIWKNETDQNVCFLTLVPIGGAVYLDNISAEISCEPTIACAEPAPANVCQGGIAEISFQICLTDLPDCMDLTLLNPNQVVLPPNWVLTSGNPGPFTLIDEGDCQTIVLHVQIPSDAPLGSMEMIQLNGTATGLCTMVNWTCMATVTVIDCFIPQGFTCACPPGGLNIDASMQSPYYDNVLGGTPYSALEAVFKYDQNSDGIISLNEHQNCIAILGNLIMDQNLIIEDCDNIQMQPCAEITVGTNLLHSTLGLTGNTIYSCDIMWHGITITPHAALDFNNNTIRDAQFAITAVGGSGIGIDPATRMIAGGSTFSNNHVGVFFPSNIFTTVNHLPFVGNTFNSTADLLPPCDAALFNYSSTLRGFAGVVTQGTPLTVGAPGNGGPVNNFSFIRNGVVSTNSAVNVQRADFQNIVSLQSPSLPSAANARGNGVAAFGGTATVLSCNFNTVGTGVLGIRNQNLIVRNNTMSTMRLGVDMRQVGSSDISDNPSIGFSQTGILFRDVVPAGGLSSHRITNNTNMFFSPFPGQGPVYTVAIEIDNAMSSDAGTARISNNHFFSGGIFCDGIRINGSGGWDVDGNTIDFQAPASPFQSNQGEGIRLTSTHANYMYQNHVNEFDPILRQSIGMSLSDGTGNRFCCNSTFGNKIGSYFFGACSATEWRVTDMQRHILALSCSNGTEISPQFDYGNNFNTSSGTAFHGGNDFEVGNSRFQVLNMVQPHWPEAIATPLTTVQFFDDGGLDANCETPCTAPQFAPPPPDRRIGYSDLTTAAGDFRGGEYGDALQWENERRLFERMTDYEGLIGADAATDDFYTTAKGGNIGAYYKAEHRSKGIYDYPEAIANGLQTSAAQLENIRLAVETALSGLANAQTAEDSAQIYQNANEKYQTAQPFVEALINYQQEAQDFSNTEAMSAYYSTLALPVTTVLERNRKAVQRLYLETIGMGIPYLTAEQLAMAEAIAFQCPLVGGSAVYAARSLYRLNMDAVFIDDSLCISSLQRNEGQKAQPALSGLSLAPNPANDLVLIKGLGLSGEQAVEVNLYDINGRLWVSRRIEQEDPSISILGLPEGVYICQVKVDGRPPVALKLIIVHH